MSVFLGSDSCAQSQNTQQYLGAFLHVPYLFSDGMKNSARVLTTGSCRISNVGQHSAACGHFTHQSLVSNVVFEAHFSSMTCPCTVCRPSVTCQEIGCHKQTFTASTYPQEVLAPNFILLLPEQHI